MKQIACPHCGNRAQVEFVYERTADSVVALDAAPGVAVAALFSRTNLRGVEEELWRHTHGCGMWLLIRRDRVSHAIEWIKPIGPEVLP
jgi:heterotetrameric sarcosine oxidase delta subunit